ncbi:MAG: metallophosphoesterase [Candidatus Diapherotrites archaeon]
MSHNPPKKNHDPTPIEMGPGFYSMGISLLIPSDGTLILSDLQLGMEEQYNNQGVFIPRFNYTEVKKHLQEIFHHTHHFDQIILNGDIKHGFGKATDQEWKEVIALLEFISPHAEKILIIKGNHDIAIEPIARFAKIEIETEGFFLEKSKTFVCHGHEIPDEKKWKNAHTIVIGHDHPAIMLKDGATKQQFKCFLIGNWKGKRLIVVPSFNFASTGSDPREGVLSPFLKGNIHAFRAWLVEDHAYDFGTLDELP